MKKVFIFGTGRCGTRTLDELFGTVPNTFSNHEGIWYDESGKQNKLGNLREFNKGIFYKGDHLDDLYKDTYLTRHTPDMESLMDELFSRRMSIIGGLQNNFNYVDINPYSYLFITYIRNKFPDAKFIHLVRDGREVVRSFLERYNTTYPDGILEKDYYGWQSAKPRPFIGSRYYDDWSDYDRFKKICWFWNFVNLEIIKRLEEESKGNVMTLRLEDLSERNFLKVINFLGMENSFDKSKLSVHNRGKKTEIKWTDERLSFFWNMNKNLMKRFGYKK